MRKGHSLSYLHNDLSKCGYENYADELIRTHRVKNSITVIAPLLTLVLLVFSLFFFNAGITSLVTVEKQFNYSDNVNLEFNENSEYLWTPENIGKLKSLKLSGSYKTEGKVKIYLEDEEIKYLIFDSDKLSKDGHKGINECVISHEC